MKKIITIIFLFLSAPVFAHHTKEHTMLMETPEQVIAATMQGESNPGIWLLWLVVIIVFGLGLFKLIYKK